MTSRIRQQGQRRLFSRFRRRSAAWLGASAFLGAGTVGTTGCGDSFSGDCATSRSCSPSGEADGGSAGSGVVAGNGDPSAGAAGDAEVGGGAGGEGAAGCETAADCSNGDASDGEERCVAGACQAGNAPPRVLSITPADATEAADTHAVITVVFSEALDPDSVTPETVQLFDGDDQVEGVLQLTGSNQQVSFQPQRPLDLWVKYRLQISSEVRDASGAELLEEVSSSFTVRDGAWSVTTLAQGEAFLLPHSLATAANGASLATWLTAREGQCSASGAWVLGGQTQLHELFASAPVKGFCAHISASIALDGSAATGWAISERLWTQSFVDDSWAAAERLATEISDGSVYPQSLVFAHDAQTMTLFEDSNGRGGFRRSIAQGPARGEWSPEVRGSCPGGTRLQLASGLDGSALAACSSDAAVGVLAYDPATKRWAEQAATVPGVAGVAIERSVPNIAIGAHGEALVLWIEGKLGALRSSYFTPVSGWEAPVTATSDTSDSPLLDSPALVFDGRSFVSAWTSTNAGELAAYTARYDADARRWLIDPPHLTELGASASSEPRLGADSHGNLMLLWAIAGNPLTLAYQRYRAETGTWEAILPVGVSFTDAQFATEGKLPFGFARNGRGGVLFRSGDIGAQTLKLAQFF